MFTGIIEAVGSLDSIERLGSDAHVSINAGKLDLADLRSGDSIAVNGVCLSVVEWVENGFRADLSAETLARTTFSQLTTGAQLNLEKALPANARLGGHLVAGHVDDMGRILASEGVGVSVRLSIEAPNTLAKYIASKGSICVDGVSLTVNSVHGATFTVNLVPHTLRGTNLGSLNSGARVNLEVDLVARYLERLLLGERAADAAG